ncbi:hypothetical protein PI124_g4279 [Phytophthora idaei]|nr:hypothetical protein PI125_g3412 [Phytophthora idaei]KAG3164471.1 hypothetical protein PI126_g5081 [Phytophthora idaei]KAG3251112.1 hypothetical protein PI124_g4279 [Phytophthora idaei]
MVQSMDEFLKLFQQKYFQSRQNLRSDLACVGLSYKWAAAEYNAKTGKAFREQDAIVEGGLTIATHTFPQAASGTVHLRVKTTEILLSPLGSTSSELSPSSAQSPLQKPSQLLSEHLEMRKVVVMERRLDLEIMTQSQEGLSDDAVEYLRWQRRLVLAKMRQQARGINKDQV